MTKKQTVIEKLKLKLFLFLSPEPEVQSEYVDKVVYLLRRDFNSKTQNDILLAIGNKLSKLREEDMVKMENDYRILEENYNILNSKMILQ